MTRDELIKAAYDAVCAYEEEKALEIAHQSVEAGIAESDMLGEGYGAGIRHLGDLFERGEVFLPELVVASEIMQNVAAYYESRMTQKPKRPGKIVLSTVEGDVHDIGKGIVAAMMKSQGYEIIDLGRDRSAADIVAAAVDNGADFIGTSALLTTTMPEQKKIEAIMGGRLDAKKFQSSMTLFDAICPGDVFGEAIDAFFDGKRDEKTLGMLKV